ncbi:hypothetical protein [Geotalea toluenoxydans]|uniref:hypothetical protein n=1 Tax=Geotalea toluenoxydans TaxID=421624 RepID=UPI001FB52388|nr:hypothetical protein [Geotalea toluenoxydans]
MEKLLAKELKKLTPERVETIYANMHAYAGKAENFAPEVRMALENLPQRFSSLIEKLSWNDVRFISDLPGKNTARRRLDGGGESTAVLARCCRGHRRALPSSLPIW